MRNMMFKSFTHEIKTPLNGVVSMIDLANIELNRIKSRNKQQTLEFKKIEEYMLSLESGVTILNSNLNDLIV